MSFAEGTPTADVELGGKVYTLGFTLGAIRRTYELGVGKGNVQDEIQELIALPRYVWACLDEEGRSALTHEAIGELINPSNLESIAGAIGKLFRLSVPDPDPNVQPAAAKEPTAGNSTSSNSGRLVPTISD